jgi:CubicO group peptidase (beta-lactamase class C family)
MIVTARAGRAAGRRGESAVSALRTLLALAVLAGALTTAPVARARDCAAVAAGIAWPAEAWRELPADRSAAEVRALEAFAFPPGLDEAGRAGVRTDGLLVVRGGAVVYERYGRGFGPDAAHAAWSVSKSVLHAVYGAAARDGLVDIDRPVAERSPWIGEGGKAGITYRHLFAMASGLDFQESYEFAPLRSSVVAMLYTRGRRDMGLFAARRPLAAEPGTVWSYKSGDSLILSRALRDLVGPERYPDYPWTALFDRIGVRSAVWERDGEGVFVGSSYLHATPRDLARVGLLYLEDGCWAGRRVLPEGWAAYAGRPAAGEGGERYGAHWWLASRRAGSAGPTAADALVARGHWGQRLVVVPRRGLVVVRTGDDRDGSFADDEFLRLVLAAFGGRG